MRLSKVHKTNNPLKLLWWWICDNDMRLFIAAVLLLLGLVLWAGTNERDNSDPPGGHSGLNIYTDNLTGAQYLGKDGYGLTPRLDRDGKQIFVEVKK